MAVAIEDGVLGLEARHTWHPLYGFDPLTMNRRDGVFPDIWIDAIRGLHALPEMDDNREPNVGRIGEQMYPGSTRGKTLVYEGRVLGETLQELRSGAAALRAVFGDVAQRIEQRMDVEPHPTYGSISHFYKARLMQFDMDDSQIYGPTRVPTPYQRRFVLGLRQGDPRYYVDDLQSETFGAAGEQTLSNLGRAPTNPKFTIAGPVAAGSWTIERRAPDTTRTLVIEDIDLTAAQTLVVVFGSPHDLGSDPSTPPGIRQVIIPETNDDLSGHIDFDLSDWWNEGVNPLFPGANTVYSSRAWTAEWFHANW